METQSNSSMALYDARISKIAKSRFNLDRIMEVEGGFRTIRSHKVGKECDTSSAVMGEAAHTKEEDEERIGGRIRIVW